MFTVVSHFPTDDINCPGIECGPVGMTKEQAIDAWKEHRLTAYEASDASESAMVVASTRERVSRIIDMASELRQKVGQAGVIFANGGEEQAYLVEVPELT